MGLVGSNAAGGIAQTDIEDIYSAINDRATVEYVDEAVSNTSSSVDELKASIDELKAYIDEAMGKAGGVIPSAETPEGNANKLWVRLPDGGTFYWSGSAWIPIKGAYAD